MDSSKITISIPINEDCINKLKNEGMLYIVLPDNIKIEDGPIGAFEDFVIKSNAATGRGYLRIGKTMAASLTYEK